MQRLVQLSQANAKLSSEYAHSRARVSGAEEAAEKAGQDLQVRNGAERTGWDEGNDGA